MTIQSDSDWKDLEQKAQEAEQRQAESFLEVTPVPEPTISQQLLWATTRAAELQARLMRHRGLVSAAWMWLEMGAVDRAKEELNRAIVDV